MQQERGFFSDVLKFALIALIIVIPIRLFVAQPFVVRGSSMEPTFHNGEYLIVDELSYRLHEPERGDVIIMRYPKDPSLFFIKRVIGLPGETVEIQGTQVIIRHGTEAPAEVLDQSFIDSSRMKDEYATYTLGPDDYFVLGDNRIASSDSRVWGVLPREDIIGRAYVRLFPPTRMGVLPGEVRF